MINSVILQHTYTVSVIKWTHEQNNSRKIRSSQIQRLNWTSITHNFNHPISLSKLARSILRSISKIMKSVTETGFMLFYSLDISPYKNIR